MSTTKLAPALALALALPSHALAQDPSAEASQMMCPRYPADYCAAPVTTCSQQSSPASTLRAGLFHTDVTFGAGIYAPYSAQGSGLLAHELSHVVQQRGPTKIWQPISIADYGPISPSLLAGMEGPAVALKAFGAAPVGTFNLGLAGFGWSMLEPAPPIARHPAIGHLGPFGLARGVVEPPTADGYAKLEPIAYLHDHTAMSVEFPDFAFPHDRSDPHAFEPGGFITLDEAKALDVLRGVIVHVLDDIGPFGVTEVANTVASRLPGAGIADAIAAFAVLVPNADTGDVFAYHATLANRVEDAATRIVMARLTGGDDEHAALADLWAGYISVRPDPW